VVALAAVLALVATSGGDPSTEKAAANRAPAGSFTLVDGNQTSLANYRGTPLVVNFFAGWCPGCYAEMPDLEQLHQRLGDQVQFLGVALQEPLSGTRAVVAETGITYPVGRDPDGALYGDFGAVAMPTTVLIDAQGRVVQRIDGAITGDGLETLIRQRLLS
jgi:peroxiredoxin